MLLLPRHRETSATSTRSGTSGQSAGRSLVTKAQAKSLDESASEHRSGLSEATASAATFSGSDSALGPKTASEERLADEASSEAGGSTGGGKDSSASGDVKGTGKHKLAKGDLNKAKSGSTSQLSQAGKCMRDAVLSIVIEFVSLNLRSHSKAFKHLLTLLFDVS